MNELLLEIGKLAPVIAILAYFIFYFKSELEIKNAEIKELNTLLRQSQLDTLNTMTKLTAVIEDLRDLIQDQFKKR